MAPIKSTGNRGGAKRKNVTKQMEAEEKKPGRSAKQRTQVSVAPKSKQFNEGIDAILKESSWEEMKYEREAKLIEDLIKDADEINIMCLKNLNDENCAIMKAKKDQITGRAKSLGDIYLEDLEICNDEQITKSIYKFEESEDKTKEESAAELEAKNTKNSTKNGKTKTAANMITKNTRQDLEKPPTSMSAKLETPMQISKRDVSSATAGRKRKTIGKILAERKIASAKRGKKREEYEEYSEDCSDEEFKCWANKKSSKESGEKSNGGSGKQLNVWFCEESNEEFSVVSIADSIEESSADIPNRTAKRVSNETVGQQSKTTPNILADRKIASVKRAKKFAEVYNEESCEEEFKGWAGEKCSGDSGKQINVLPCKESSENTPIKTPKRDVGTEAVGKQKKTPNILAERKIASVKGLKKLAGISIEVPNEEEFNNGANEKSIEESGKKCSGGSGKDINVLSCEESNDITLIKSPKCDVSIESVGKPKKTTPNILIKQKETTSINNQYTKRSGIFSEERKKGSGKQFNRWADKEFSEESDGPFHGWHSEECSEVDSYLTQWLAQ